MRRGVFAFLAVVSLILLVVIVILWLREAGGDLGGGTDIFYYARAGGRFWRVESDGGWLELSSVNGWPNDEPPGHFFFPHWHGIDGPFPAPHPVVETPWHVRGVAHGEFGDCRIELQADGRAFWENGTIAAYVLGKYPDHASVPLPYWSVGVREWLLVFLTSLVPLITISVAARSALAKRRLRRGICPACGYDLRATPDRCPECGTPVPPKPEAAR
jgi:hypothetical protein